MSKNKFAYESPKINIYEFDNNDRILTESGGFNPPITLDGDFAAASLNDFLGGLNTTVEF